MWNTRRPSVGFASVPRRLELCWLTTLQNVSADFREARGGMHCLALFVRDAEPEAGLTSSAQTTGATQHSRGLRSPLLLRPRASLLRVSDLPGSPVAAALDDSSAPDRSYFGPISCARRALSAYLHARRRCCRPPHLGGWEAPPTRRNRGPRAPLDGSPS
jgi:hypothetical protein